MASRTALVLLLLLFTSSAHAQLWRATYRPFDFSPDPTKRIPQYFLASTLADLPGTDVEDGDLGYVEDTDDEYVRLKGSWVTLLNATTTLPSGWVDDGATVRLATVTDNVSIGFATGAGKLAVTAGGGSVTNVFFDGFATAANLNLRRAGNVPGLPTVVSLGQTVGMLSHWAYDGGAYRETSSITNFVASVPASDNIAGDLCFYTRPTGAAAVKLLRGCYDNKGGLVLGDQAAALATTATDGFFYLRSMAGVPTGVPTAFVGTVPLTYDTSGNNLFAYNAGAWKNLSAAGGGGAPTDAEYAVAALHAGLSAERLLTDTATVTWDFGTAGQAKANASGGSGLTHPQVMTRLALGGGY